MQANVPRQNRLPKLMRGRAVLRQVSESEAGCEHCFLGTVFFTRSPLITDVCSQSMIAKAYRILANKSGCSMRRGDTLITIFNVRFNERDSRRR